MWSRLASAVGVDDLRQDGKALEITFRADSRRADYKNTALAVRPAIVEASREARTGRSGRGPATEAEEIGMRCREADAVENLTRRHQAVVP